MSERDRQRRQAAADGLRGHAEEQVAGGHGPGKVAIWTVELLIAAVIGLVVYLYGTWTAAVLGGVIWLAAALVRMYAVRSKRRRRRSIRPPE